MALFQELGDRRRIVRCLECLAVVAHVQGKAERAARLFGVVEAQFEAIGVPLGGGIDRFMVAARAQLDGTTLVAWAEGRAMTLEHAISEALNVAA
jgi:hypothetical protein